VRQSGKLLKFWKEDFKGGTEVMSENNEINHESNSRDRLVAFFGGAIIALLSLSGMVYYAESYQAELQKNAMLTDRLKQISTPIMDCSMLGRSFMYHETVIGANQ
jgi:hypothetical protein